MTISVKFFASLREQVEQSETSLDACTVNNVQQVWDYSTNGMIMPDNTLCAINMEYVSRDHAVQDGDEVAFFPPVTGG